MIMQTKCPGCRQKLRIPAGWMHQPIRCKHCGIVVQLQQKAGKVKAALPAGKIPSKVPAGAITGSAPQAPAALRGGSAPAAIPLANGRSRGKGRIVKAGFAIAWMIGLAVLIGGVYAATQFLGDSSTDEKEVAQVDEKLPKDKVTKRAVSKLQTKRWKRQPANIRVKQFFYKEEKALPPPPPPLPPIPADVFATIARAEQQRRPTRPGQPRPGRPAIPANVPVTIEPSDGIANRSMLAISVNNYLYYNPTAYGATKAAAGQTYNFRDLLGAMAKQLKFARVTEFSDATPVDPKPPLKVLIEKAITDFTASSRPQDRIVVFFSGHIVEEEEIPYLVPYDGIGSDKTSLIPLSWVMGEFAKSKARQKVFILDVCRFDPSYGYDRPGSGELGEKTVEMLSKPPAGVQVWASSSAGQISYADPAYGSLFQSQIKLAMQTVAAQDAKESLPIKEIAEVVNTKTGELAASMFEDAEQKPMLWGTEIVDGAAPYNATEKAPPKVAVTYVVPTAGVAGFAPRAFVEGILNDIKKIPPTKPGVAYDINTFPLFKEDALKGYEPDVAMTPFRTTINNAIALLDSNKGNFKQEFRGTVDAIKKEANTIQIRLAPAVLEFDEMLDEMREAAKELEAEKSKRWQALYHYTLARLLERKAYVFEYNYMLGMIRTDSLPELNAKFNHKGWKLASRERLSAKGNEGREAKKHDKEAKEILHQVVEDHKGTPFAVTAARDAQNYIGLTWEAVR